VNQLLRKRCRIAGYVTVGLYVACTQSWASSPYEAGVKLYGEHNYRAAAVEFEKAIASSSVNPNVLYYCALSHQMSSQPMRARQLYEYIVKNFPNSSVVPLANKALSQLQNVNGNGDSQETAESTSSKQSNSPGETERDLALDKAKADCDQIMKKAEQQVEDEKSNSQTMYIDADGHTAPDISQERKREIREEAQQRCAKIMERAERAAREKTAYMQSTKPGWTSTTRTAAGHSRDGSDLISVVRNQGNHPAVSQLEIAQVKSALESFPPQFLDLLRANKAKVQLTPTMIDLFPNLKNTKPRGYEEGRTYKNCPALFSYPNIVVAENALIGDDDSNWQKMDDPIGSMRHEMGHALDAFLGDLTQTEEFKHVYYLDLGRLDQPTRERLSYYTQKSAGGPSEAFAEVFAGLYGKRSVKERQEKNDEVVSAFPGLAALIKKKIAEIKPGSDR